MENIIGPFDSFSSEIYDRKISKVAGFCEHKTLRLAEKFALRLVKTYDSVFHQGPNVERKKFRAELFPETLSDINEVDFYFDIENERAYTKLLEREGVIQDRKSWKDKVELVANVAGNCAFLAATSPISISLGAIGMGLRCYVQNHMHAITCLKPHVVKVWEEGEDLDIFTSNVALTEFQIMDYINGVSDTKARVKEWVRKLAELDADVICLQEAFDVDEIYPIIAKELKALGYCVVMVTKRAQVLGMTAGLLLASRYQITDVGFHEYTDLMGLDKRSRKGVLAAMIQLNEDTNICVATTHMQAAYPKGTHEERVEWKTQQFYQARHFINRFIEESDVRDVFFVGDFNASRFDLGLKLDEAITKYSYPAIVNGILKPTTYQQGFKDLTYPDRPYNFEEYLDHETKFNHHKPSNNETGSSKGSCCDTSATSYHYFVDIVTLKVARQVIYSTRNVRKLVEKRLSGKDLKSKHLTKIIDHEIENLKKTMYIKPNVVDHVTLMDYDDNVFDETGYEYEIIHIVGKTGPLTDHASLKVKLHPSTLYH
ncbi:MAG: hypothetical protein K940chlam3_00904 [Chlamydiae bacterium]|nr:hypothetical protein [Chlamydiota bacterium]